MQLPPTKPTFAARRDFRAPAKSRTVTREIAMKTYSVQAASGIANSRRRAVLLALVAGAFTMCSEVGTAHEAARGPAIVVKSPQTSAPISGPVKIEVAFVSSDAAPIDPDSFRVTY